jgi:hypothetical protein
MRPTAQIFWNIIYKLFPIVRNVLLRVGIIWHSKKRQPFAVGKLTEDVSLATCRKHLIEKGFEKNILAWIDSGEVISMRKIDPIQPHCHYHIRIFNDGEVRGHYEKMPERHPIDHFLERGMQDRADYFRSIMGELMEGSTISPYSSTDILENAELEKSLYEIV